MSRLDRDRPYGEEWGDGCGFRGYVQDGKLFRPDGTSYDHVEEPEPAVDPSAAVVSGKGANLAKARAARAAKRAEAKAASDAAPASDSGLSDLDDGELMALVEVNGGTWTNRAAALAFLGDK